MPPHQKLDSYAGMAAQRSMTTQKDVGMAAQRTAPQKDMGRGATAGWVKCPLCPPRRMKRYARGRGLTAHLEAVHGSASLHGNAPPAQHTDYLPRTAIPPRTLTRTHTHTQTVSQSNTVQRTQSTCMRHMRNDTRRRGRYPAPHRYPQTGHPCPPAYHRPRCWMSAAACAQTAHRCQRNLHRERDQNREHVPDEHDIDWIPRREGVDPSPCAARPAESGQSRGRNSRSVASA